MAALDNARHERFAQELAKGKSATEAYAEAGYAPNDGNCIRLKGNERVQARVAEIQERAATRVEVSVASITANLLRIADKAELLSEASGLSVARAAQMDIAKLNGLAPEKVQLAAAVAVADANDKAGMEELGRWASAILDGGGKAAD